MKHAIQEQIVDIMSRCNDMTVATVRPDGAPQATVVSFVHDGLTMYFACGAQSQKAGNIAHEPRVSVTMTPPYDSWTGIEGLSMAATATEVTGAAEIETFRRLMLARFPAIAEMEEPDIGPVRIFRLRPKFVSVLDYGKGFGHTDLVAVGPEDISLSRESMRHHWLIPAGTAR